MRTTVIETIGEQAERCTSCSRTHVLVELVERAEHWVRSAHAPLDVEAAERAHVRGERRQTLRGRRGRRGDILRGGRVELRERERLVVAGVRALQVLAESAQTPEARASTGTGAGVALETAQWLERRAAGLRAVPCGTAGARVGRRAVAGENVHADDVVAQLVRRIERSTALLTYEYQLPLHVATLLRE